MDIYVGVYRYTAYNGKQRIVPIERVHWLGQLQRGDHIALLRYKLYWHHAIVEDVDTQNGEIHVIAYTKRDNSSHGKRRGKVKVRRKKHNLHDDTVYLIQHKECLPAETVVDTAQFYLDEGGYNLLTNNCEHFALLCKTNVSSSEQVKVLKERFKKELMKTELCTARKTGVRVASKKVVTQAVSNGGQAIVDTGTRHTTKAIVDTGTRHTTKAIVDTGTRHTTKAIVDTGTHHTTRAIVDTGTRHTTKAIVDTGTRHTTKAIVDTGTRHTTKAIVDTGTRHTTRAIVKTGTHHTTRAIVKTGTHHATRAIVKTGTLHTTRKVFTHTASKAGEEIVTKGTRVATKEFVTQTTTQTGSEAVGSLLGGAACAAVFEGASVMYDIHCAGEEMRKGNLSKQEFDRTVEKRIVGGIGSVAGTTAGAAIGQVLIPVPIVGAFIGGLAGGILGRLFGDSFADS